MDVEIGGRVATSPTRSLVPIEVSPWLVWCYECTRGARLNAAAHARYGYPQVCSVIDRPRVAFMVTVEEGAFGHDVVFDLHDARAREVYALARYGYVCVSCLSLDESWTD